MRSSPPAPKKAKAETATIVVEGGFSIEVLSSYGGEPPKMASKKTDEAVMSVDTEAAETDTKADETDTKADETGTEAAETGTKAPETDIKTAEARRRAMESLSVPKRMFVELTDWMVSEGALTAEILRPAYLRAYEKVFERDVVGMCSRCEWGSGCSDCEPFKALRYWVRKELQNPQEEVRAKAKGRPKRRG